MPTIYEQLESKCLPLIKHYQTDLTEHDKKAITENPHCRFLHYTNESGTYIIFLPEHDDPSFPPSGFAIPYLFGTATREHIARQIKSMAEYHIKPSNPQPIAVHYFNGKTLLSKTPSQAFTIADIHTRHLLDTWDKQERKALCNAS